MLALAVQTFPENRCDHSSENKMASSSASTVGNVAKLQTIMLVCRFKSRRFLACVNPVFFKRPRLISPPVFAPLSKPVEDAVFLPREQAEGKLKWSKKTSLVPWPVVQDRALARVLES